MTDDELTRALTKVKIAFYALATVATLKRILGV